MTQALKVMTSAYGAEHAKGPVTFQAAISKSGSAGFHGEGYLYARLSIFNAEDSYQQNQGITKPDDHYYYPGGNRAVNGWELSGVTQVQSGAPIQPNTNGNLNVQIRRA